ncbi:unnamed protein product [Discosporangium mesarthrocarpum]
MRFGRTGPPGHKGTRWNHQSRPEGYPGPQDNQSERPSVVGHQERHPGSSHKVHSRGQKTRELRARESALTSKSDAEIQLIIENSLKDTMPGGIHSLRDMHLDEREMPKSTKVALMGRVISPSVRGSIPTHSGKEKPRVSRSKVHAVCIVVEQSHRDNTPSPPGATASVHDLTVWPVNEGQTGKDASRGVGTHRRWLLKNLSGVERKARESSAFSLIFEVGNKETAYSWNGVSADACEEILWGILTMHKALVENHAFEPVNVSLKELDATAVYHGLAAKHPLVLQHARDMQGSQRRGSYPAPEGFSETDTHTVDKGGDRMPQRREVGVDQWVYDEYEEGEAALARLKWMEKGQEGLMEELSLELETLEGGTIQQLIAWSEKTDETETLISLLDEVDEQLQVMEEWLEQHGQPLEAMQLDMAAIESKNNALDVQWRSYQVYHVLMLCSISYQVFVQAIIYSCYAAPVHCLKVLLC